MVDQLVKFVGFIPEDHLEAVRSAVFNAGAGHIGDYDQCSWSTPGTGTFRGSDSTTPTIGTPGVFEEVAEVRFETICSQAKLAAVVTAFITEHPYEEPAYEVYALLLPRGDHHEVPQYEADPVTKTPSTAGSSHGTANGAAPRQLWFDGGSRGNPGPAASGFIIRDATGGEIFRRGDALGTVTNNVAEYSGLVRGLACAIDLGATDLEIYSDSELVVKQLLGAYKVKHPDMKRLYDQAQVLLAKLDRYSVKHVLRGKNADADALVNETLDSL